MKKVLLSVAVIAAMVGVVMSSCKKDESTQQNKGVAQTEQSVSKSEQKIIDFLADFSAMKQGVKAEGEAVAPEEALWQWETTLNYCYGFTQDELVNGRLDTVVVTMPQPDATGNIAYCDLMETYSSIINAVREKYVAIDVKDKVLQFVMMSFEDGVSKSDNGGVRVIMNTGSRSAGPETPTPTPDPGPWYGRPFYNDDNWIWGMNLGKCDGSVLESDAAQQLTEKVLFYDLDHSLVYTPCPTCYTFIENPHVVQFYTGFYGAYDSVFCATGLTWDEVLSYCIPWQDMKMYYAWIMQKSHYPGMTINPYGYDWYYKVIVEDHKCHCSDAHWKIWHEVSVINATRRWRRLDPSYPVPIDEETQE